MSQVTGVLFLGTGTSSQVPTIACLTADPPTCAVCIDGASSPRARNRRRNTSVLVRAAHPDGRTRNILIDCGKSFYEATITFFPENGIRQLDAVILTHDHADAVLGLDDLRMFTLNGKIQSHVDVYLTKRTMRWIANMFPYMVDTSKATGGGDVPSIRFHELEDDVTPFTVEGLTFQPLQVLHGPAYQSLGFRFDDISYISDVSVIPPETEALMAGSQMVILDALNWDKPHASHLCALQAIEYIDRLQPRLGYLTGFAHLVGHDTAETTLSARPPTAPEIHPAYDGLLVPWPPATTR